MDRNKELAALRQLREKIKEYNLAEAEVEKAAEALLTAETREPTAVSEFDRAHKETYVISQIGRAPLRPREKIEVTVVDRTRKRYEKDFADYKKKYNRFSEAYYEDYAEQRRKLEAEEQKDIATEILQSKKQYEEARTKADRAKEAVDEDDSLGRRMKDIETVDALIGYVEDRRADTVKEAVNLYYEDDHRRRLEEYAKEQVRITKEASAFARAAAQSAEKAAASAVKAAERADEAVDQAKIAAERADEAFKTAAKALEEADSVYIEALLK